MSLTPLQTILWLAPTCVEIVIVMVMLYRKLWHDLPIFGCYLLFEVTRTCWLFTQRHDPVRYFYWYWITEALGCLAALWVIKELFDNAFMRQLGLRRLGNVLFQWSIAILLISAVVIAYTSSGGDTKKLMAGIYAVKRTVTFVEAGLLGFLFLFVATLGIGWQRYATGLCLGFGIYGAVELSAVTARAIYGPTVNHLMNWLIMSANTCCVLIWGACFLMPEPKHSAKPVALDQSRLDEWNKALLQLMRR